MELRDLDLNLLVVFNQLLRERKVSAAAESLGLTHSVRADRKAAEQVLIYMNAKAQEQIALTLIARMPAPRP